MVCSNDVGYLLRTQSTHSKNNNKGDTVLDRAAGLNTRRSFPIIYISAYSFVVECWEEYCAILGKRPFAAASVDPVGNILVLMEREGGRPTADVCALLASSCTR